MPKSSFKLKKIFSGTLLLLILLLSACQPALETPQIEVIIPTDEPVTRTPFHTPTPIPTRTFTPTFTATAANTPTATPYANLDYSQLEISFGGFLSHWRYFVVFQFPDAVEGNYYAIVDRNKDYKCEVLPDYPDRLYCIGPLVIVYNWAEIDLYAEGIQEPIYSGEFFVPLLDES